MILTKINLTLISITALNFTLQAKEAPQIIEQTREQGQFANTAIELFPDPQKKTKVRFHPNPSQPIRRF